MTDLKLVPDIIGKQPSLPGRTCSNRIVNVMSSLRGLKPATNIQRMAAIVDSSQSVSQFSMQLLVIIGYCAPILRISYGLRKRIAYAFVYKGSVISVLNYLTKTFLWWLPIRRGVVILFRVLLASFDYQYVEILWGKRESPVRVVVLLPSCW